MAQTFWPKLPVILEHEHYGPSKKRGAWSDDLLVQSVEEYHASYLSIHWWPREELNGSREAIGRVNQRLGYRLQLKEMNWPASIALGRPFVVEARWANGGVAPCYAGGYWALTLKDALGGIVSVNVDDSFNLRDLAVGPPGEAPVRKSTAQFVVALKHVDPRGNHAPPTRPGDCDVFISVGMRDGTPQMVLPLPGGDGQKRYRVGKLTLTE
jgi:hypothetical protein